MKYLAIPMEIIQNFEYSHIPIYKLLSINTLITYDGDIPKILAYGANKWAFLRS